MAKTETSTLVGLASWKKKENKMKIREIIEGLQIIAKYCDEGLEKHDSVEGDHEIVYAQPDKNKDDHSIEDVKKLEELGWHWNDELDCWAMHT